MRKAPIILIAGLWIAAIATSGHHAHAARSGITADMIRTALEAAHVSTTPGSVVRLLDRREGANGWHNFRLDDFKITVHGGHTTIDIETSQLN